MKTCPSCGRVIVDPAAAICPNCGAELSAPAPGATQAWPQAEQPAAPAVGGPEYGHPAAPSQPMYPYPGYPPQPTAPSQPLYPYGGYPAQPAPPSQPMYPYGAYPQGPGLPPAAYPPPYTQAPGANWRPAQERRGSSALVIGLVIALVVAVLGGIGLGAYALTSKVGPRALVSSPSVTPTATAPSDALLNDPMSNNNNGWPVDNDHHCYFSSDGYHVANSRAQSGYYEWYCGAPMGAIADGSVTVTVKEVSGVTRQPYGIAFRFNKSDTVTSYWFAIDANSKWALFRDVNDKLTRLQDYTYSPAIHGGLNDENTLSVEFRGQTITCKINGVTMGVVTDPGSSLGSGYVVLEVGENVNAVFTDFLVLP